MGNFISNFETTADFAAFSATTAFQTPHLSLTQDDGKIHFMKYLEPVDPCASEIVKTTYEWVEIGGVKWATKNVGAESITDYGQYFSWGGVNGYTIDQVSGECHSKAYSWSDYELGNGGSAAAAMTKYNSTDGKKVLETVDDAATFNMGSGWRMPTEADFNALMSATTNAWVTNYQGSNINGRLFTDKTDSSKVLFFPAAGLYRDGSVHDVGSYGSYWSGSLETSNVTLGRLLNFYSDNCNMSRSRRHIGFSVRGVVG